MPKKASPALLMSMDIRSDHGLGMPGYYDQMIALFQSSSMASAAKPGNQRTPSGGSRRGARCPNSTRRWWGPDFTTHSTKAGTLAFFFAATSRAPSQGSGAPSLLD